MERIAIIGMAGRFPGANTLRQFWENLRNGVESITFFSDEELLASGVPQDLLNSSSYVRARGVLEDVELFDAGFFGINPREAEITDPQHRLFLECAWEALEHAGYDSEKYDNLIGVFAASSVSRYGMSLYRDPHLLEVVGVSQVLISNGADHLPTQVSYRMNLKGPSIAVQTSCSSSLVAVQLACQSLLNYQCDMALAGGVTIIVPQTSGYVYQEGGTHSPDGRCRAFDAKAQGLVEGNAVGIIVLKRLSEALADGDYIHAVIRGSAVNNDGSRKVGYTAPSVDGQVEVIKVALSMAEVEAETISYIEAHGTGTVLGDPMEVAALTQAFRTSTNMKHFCALGSVKTNIGHTDAAAGVAGLIKTTLALRHQMLPPSLHYEEPNPQIDFNESPFYVNVELREWPGGRTGRRAGVSSFGIGGTNAHVVVEEAPTRATGDESGREWHLLPLSARTEKALEEATDNLIEYLEGDETEDLADVAYTLQMGRREMPHRRMLIGREVAGAVSALQHRDSPHVETQVTERLDRPIIFMFPGQGTQRFDAGLDLYNAEPLFREAIDQSAELLLPHLGKDLRPFLYPKPEQREEATKELNKTYLTQPVLFVVEYALAKLWMSWGVQPAAMIGHSIGEYVAACLAGVFTLEDALMLVASRGRLMQGLPSGAMLAVQLSAEQAQTLLRDGLSLAAVNDPVRCVIAGVTTAIDALEKQLNEDAVPCHRLNTSRAFHSEMVDTIQQEFVALFEQVSLRAPELPYISNVTGSWVADAEATDPEYWGRHMRQTVRFADGLRELLKEPERIFLEVGPGQTLSALARQHPDRSSEQPILSSLPSAFESHSDSAFVLTNLGRLWLAGTPVNWKGYHAFERRRRVPLPTYPFQRQRYWIEPKKATDYDATQQQRPHKKHDIAQWFYYPSWKRSTAPNVLDQSVHARQARTWLVFVDESGIGSRLIEKLELAGRQVIGVTAGEHFGKLDKHTYQINPHQPNDYELLLQELAEAGQLPQVILHLWTISEGKNDSASDESLAQCQERGFYSLLFLAKALGKRSFTSALQLEVVSSGIQQVHDGEELCPAKATVLGPCRVIPQEYSHITCRSVDIVLPTGEVDQENLVKQLLAEFESEPAETVVAYRGQSRWVQIIEPLRIEGRSETPSVLKEGGVYLLTGGLGHIGFVLAQYLARAVSAKLVLLGPTRLPPRDEWEHWLTTHSEQDEMSSKLRRAQKVEAAGAEVLPVFGDVAREEDVAAAIKQSIQKFGTLDGVIHLAGVGGGKGFRAIQSLSVNECELHFQSKVYGLAVLERALRGLKLDFCLLFSSLSTVLGGLGFCAYSAANSFAGAFAQRQQGRASTPWLNVDWDGWQTETIKTEGAGVGLSEMTISPEEGIETLRRILSSRLPHLVVSTGDLHARMVQWIQPGRREDAQQVSDRVAPIGHSRPRLKNAFVAPRNDLERAVTMLWEQLLGIEGIGADDDFFELNGDSLLATQVIARVRKVLQVDVPLQTLFETPTITALANAIEANEAVPGQAQRIARALSRIKAMSAPEVLKSLQH